MQEHSIYVHIPFCRHRCAYCDFNTYSGIESQIPAYIAALCREIEITGRSAGRRLLVHTVFFGGGTPSLLEADYLRDIFDALNNSFELQEEAEISLEANPGTLTPGYLQEIKRFGINRLSLGMQSARLAELRQLERQHSFLDVIQSVKWARDAGFDNLNLDLIFGLPDQTLSEWQVSLEWAVSLLPEHLAVYSLILESGTPMKRWADRGLINIPDPDSSADMYDWTTEYLSGLGYSQYEISNWARFNQEKLLSCLHNLQYWRLKPYLGFGAGAHGFINKIHTVDVRSPFEYIRRLSERDSDRYLDSFPMNPATDVIESVSPKTEMSELMLMGLRLTREGVSNQDFLNRFGVSYWEAYHSQIDKLVSLGLLEIAQEDGERLRLTKHGRLLGNRVFIEFIDEQD